MRGCVFIRVDKERKDETARRARDSKDAYCLGIVTKKMKCYSMYVPVVSCPQAGCSGQRGSRRIQPRTLMAFVPGRSPVQSPHAGCLNGVLFCDRHRGLAMRPDILPVMPVVPALCVGDVVAEEERRGGLEEPHVLLDEVHDDRPPDALVVVPRVPAFAPEPDRPGVHSARCI